MSVNSTAERSDVRVERETLSQHCGALAQAIDVDVARLESLGDDVGDFGELVGAEALRPAPDETALDSLRDRVTELAAARPLYPTLKEASL